MHKHMFRGIHVAVTGGVIALATAVSAAAFQALPPGGQVNDDLAAGINKAIERQR